MADEQQDQREWSTERWVAHKQALGRFGTGTDDGSGDETDALHSEDLDKLTPEDFFKRLSRGRP